jgi:hypothetical protein
LVNREERRDRGTGLMNELIAHQPLGIGARRNVLLLVAVVLVLLAKGALPLPFGATEATLLAIAYVATGSHPVRSPRPIISFGPIAAVTVIFAGVFVTMPQPLLVLNARAAQIGLEEPAPRQR